MAVVAVPIFLCGRFGGMFKVTDERLGGVFRRLLGVMDIGGRTPPLLLLGDSGVGKLRWSRELVRDYGCDGSYKPFRGVVGGGCSCRVCEGVGRGNLLDVLEIRCGGVSVGEFRDRVSEFCGMGGGVELGFRFIFLMDVDLLGVGGVDSLLRVLEEVPLGVQFVLMARGLEGVSGALVSRCHVHILGRMDVGVLKGVVGGRKDLVHLVGEVERNGLGTVDEVELFYRLNLGVRWKELFLHDGSPLELEGRWKVLRGEMKGLGDFDYLVVLDVVLGYCVRMLLDYFRIGGGDLMNRYLPVVLGRYEGFFGCVRLGRVGMYSVDGQVLSLLHAVYLLRRLSSSGV